MNTVEHAKATFIDHKNNHRPIYKGWKDTLDQYLKQLPTGFTFNYIFEFTNGQCVMKENTSSKVRIEYYFCLPENLKTILPASLDTVFGIKDLEQIRTGAVQPILSRKKLKEFKDSKLKVLFKLYDVIPDRYLHYCPEL